MPVTATGPLAVAVDALRSLIANVPFFQTWTGTANPTDAGLHVFAGDIGYPISSVQISGGILTVITREPSTIQAGQVVTLEGAGIGAQSEVNITGPQTVLSVAGTSITFSSGLGNLPLTPVDNAFVLPCGRPVAVICWDTDAVRANSVGNSGANAISGALTIYLEADVTSSYANDQQNAVYEAANNFGEFFQGLNDTAGTADFFVINECETVKEPEFVDMADQNSNAGRFERWAALVKVTWGFES